MSKKIPPTKQKISSQTLKSKKAGHYLQQLAAQAYGDYSDLVESFHFDPEAAEIMLHGERMVLTDNKSLGIMRRELILALGYERTRALLSRTGYEMGASMAELALTLRQGQSIFDIFEVGPQLHALKGSVRVEAKVFDVNPETKEFYSEYYWHNSAECAAHLDQMGISHAPAAWQQIGLASGYASAVFGFPIIFREQECIAMGHEKCVLIGKPASQWTDADAELRWFRAENYSSYNNPKTPSPHNKQTVNKKRNIVGASAGFNLTLHLVDKVAKTNTPVLFTGESGVGKEVFAKELHKRSKQAQQPLVTINCAAIPETLLEAELFGVEKGAFTGADKSRPGRFERAAGGTIFLDEIGTLSFSAQGKLLRVLHEHEYERVGGNTTLISTARVIAATNANLLQDVEKGNFREDLFHRLNTFPIHIPPLRSRRTDIPVLMDYLLQKLTERHGKKIPGFSNATVRVFQQYHWPGNVREMENIIERGVILAEVNESIDLQHLIMSADPVFSQEDIQNKDPFRFFVLSTNAHYQATNTDSIGEQLLDSGLNKNELLNALIKAALSRSHGSITKAAKISGLSRSQINYWMKNNSNKQ